MEGGRTQSGDTWMEEEYQDYGRDRKERNTILLLFSTSLESARIELKWHRKTTIG